LRDKKDCIIWDKDLCINKYNNNYFQINSPTANDEGDSLEDISDLTVSSDEHEQHMHINNIYETNLKKPHHDHYVNHEKVKKNKRARKNSNTSENSNLTSTSTTNTEITTTSSFNIEIKNYQDDITYSELLNNPMKKQEICQMEKSHNNFMKSWLDFENNIYFNLNYFIKNDFIDIYNCLNQKNSTLELNSLKCSIGGPYLNQLEKGEDDCEKIRKKTRYKQSTLIKAYECYQRNKISSLNTANAINNSYRLKKKPIFLYSLSDLDISNDNIEKHPKSVNPLLNLIHKNSKLGFDDSFDFKFNNKEKESDSNISIGSNNDNNNDNNDNENEVFLTKSDLNSNDSNEKILKDENEYELNSCISEKYIGEDEKGLNNSYMNEFQGSNSFSLANSNNNSSISIDTNINENRLPDIDSNSIKHSNNTNFQFDNTSYYKRNIDKECEYLQKARDKLMDEFVATVSKYKKYKNLKRATQIECQDSNKLIYTNHRNNRILNKSSLNNNKSYVNKPSSSSTKPSSSSSSLKLQESQNSIYIEQLRHPNCTSTQHEPSSLNNTIISSSQNQLSQTNPYMIKIDSSKIRSVSQIPDVILNKNKIPLTMKTLIARDLPVIESKFPISRIYWMKNVANNF
ncbi:hypothetical protein BCR36DRAFT_259672, partial [Piromyces finnis]